jgi:hypothetical protein
MRVVSDVLLNEELGLKYKVTSIWLSEPWSVLEDFLPRTWQTIGLKLILSKLRQRGSCCVQWILEVLPHNLE